MSGTEIVDLIRAIAWPLAVVIGLFALRKAMPSLLRELGQRTTRVSVFQFAVELAPPAPLAGQPPLTVNLFNEPVADPSFLPHLFGQLLVSTPVDYMVVDLGKGQSWLTSRLFIWSEMLRRVRGLRSIVFVRHENGLDGRFAGITSPEDVKRSLAARYEWLERDLAFAYADALKQQEPVDRESGVMPQATASNVVIKFMERLQAKPDGTDQDEWVLLPRKETEPEVWERARWIDPMRLGRLVPAIDESAYVVHSLQTPRSELAKAVLRGNGDFVALVDERFRFISLADRRALLEKAATTAYSD
jgi:hypothetical protein